MKGTAGALIAATLHAHRVTHIFGMADPVHVFHALDRGAIQPVTVRDEKHGAIMAHGYAKATGRPGVCAATTGPGATNLVTGLFEASKSSVPVIALVQETPGRLIGKHAASEVDQAAALAPVSKWIGRIVIPEKAAEVTRAAFRIATSGRPGPAVVLCPADVMGQVAEAEVYAEPGCERFPSFRSRASRESVAAAAALLAAARRPVIVAGGGCILSQAWDQVVELAEAYGIPVATTMTGRGAIADAHPLSVGVLGSSTGGRHGVGRIANRVLAEADLAFIIGSRTGQIVTSDWTLPRPGTRVIHLDVDPIETGRNVRTDVALIGDARDTLVDLLEHCREQKIRPEVDTTTAYLGSLKAERGRLIEPLSTSAAVPIQPERLLREISRVIDGRTLIAADASYITGWALSHVANVAQGCTFISPRGTGGLGWALPAAIGAKLADPTRTVICLTGDGGFGYVMNELETAARYRAKIVTVVFNNGTLAFQKHYEEKLFGTAIECELLDVDYSEVARALKCGGERVVDPGAISPALERGLASDRPYVVDVVIDARAKAPIVGLESPDDAPGH
ncbi:MAG TPA: thiamine pyrophosphate-dependent enzyme [Methylomirabilota bacterium]|nr:thiamine pyrophosphate-dependent enzyme [Methylomirabilota bacterium]